MGGWVGPRKGGGRRGWSEEEGGGGGGKLHRRGFKEGRRVDLREARRGWSDGGGVNGGGVGLRELGEEGLVRGDYMGWGWFEVGGAL